MKNFTFTPLVLAVSCSIGLLSGCGSSGSSSTDASISGTIVAAPVDGAQVSVIDANGNVVAGPVTTNAAGVYSLNLADASLAQDLIIKSNGGSFIDEATGNTGTAGEMLAYASANSLKNGSNICATPSSTIIANLITKHNKSITQATETFNNAFGYTPDTSLTPAVATSSSADASEAEKLAGFRAAAFSQLAMDLNLSQNNQFEMFNAIAQDLSDGTLDGVDASGAINIASTNISLSTDIKNRFSTALLNFHASGYNQTGLENNQIGNVPFSKFALTSSYQIEYIETSMMPTMEGKSSFQIHITDRNTGADVIGLTPMVMPMMHMSSMSHSSPVAEPAVTEDGNGLYTVNLYYLMASQMMDGTAMGYWDLEFNVASEIAHFYPVVKMAMGDTVRTRLKGQTDLIKNMMGMDVSRDYFIFKDSLTGMGPYTLTFFIAANESMMSYPAVINNTQLTSGMGGTPLDITSIAVDVSLDGGTATAALDNGNGSWSIDLPMTAGVNSQIEVTLSINGERKTSDGTASGLNSTFSITPASM